VEPSAPLEQQPAASGAWHEALLYVEWARGAGGRYLAGAGPVPRVPPAGSRAAGAPGAEHRVAVAQEQAQEPMALAQGPEVWGRLEAEVAGCTRCRLCSSRTQTVFGAGSRTPRLVVVGEAPGAEEDRQGLPFVGPAGELLTRMLAAIGLSREHDVFVVNVLKCRPPDNRPPAPDEVAACKPYLREQLGLLGPPLLLALGNHACRALLATERGITSLRGRFTTTPEGWRVMPTFHPAYLLRNPGAKREVWDDLKLVAKDLGLR
jgi:uracil-DNA glycosylase